LIRAISRAMKEIEGFTFRRRLIRVEHDDFLDDP